MSIHPLQKRNSRQALICVLLALGCFLTGTRSDSQSTSQAVQTEDQHARATRLVQPEDLFRTRLLENATWSPDGRYVAIEITREQKVLGSEFERDIELLDARTGSMRKLNSPSANYIGFFGVKWSPGGKRLAFLSADSKAVARVWIWTAGTTSPVSFGEYDIRAGFTGDNPIAWLGDDRLALLAWETGAKRYGNLYTEIFRGPNEAEGWKNAADGQAAASAMESGAARERTEPVTKLVVVNVRTGAASILARGRLHDVSASSDERLLEFHQEEPGLPGQAVTSYFALTAGDVDAAYVAANIGTAVHVIDASTGANAPAESFVRRKEPGRKIAASVTPPVTGAKIFSTAPAGNAILFSANASDGSHLWLCGVTSAPKASYKEVWEGNRWASEIKTGNAQSIAYKTVDGAALTAWLLMPPEYKQGTKAPMVTIVYPGDTYENETPSDFSLYSSYFWGYPQIYAAMGYAVLLPSMPVRKTHAETLAHITDGVLPAVDAAIATGTIDPERIAVAGQSDGGFATIALITQTNRFRSAIESAGFSDLTSFYGTFYGQFRYGDAGTPEHGQVLRMLQMEKGVFNFGAPPWQQPDEYRAASPIFSADKVNTPLMLIHGDKDFVPIQQGEEFFTALMRQDKRAELVRYQGEGHTISSRADVLDLWKRVREWLAETMK